MIGQSLTSRLATIIFIILTIQGCAGKPWTDPLGETESKTVKTIFSQMQDREAHCSCCQEADITMSWNTPLTKKSIGGFLETRQPSSIKFIMTNPLGQPVFAMVTSNLSFQSINTVYRTYQSGGLNSLLLYHDAPQSLLSSNWATYLMGRLGQGPAEIVATRNDKEKRGVWLTIRFSDGDKIRKSHLLIDMVNKRLLARMISQWQVGDNDNEESVAIIHYDDWLPDNSCPIPTKLRISEYSLGAELNVQLSKISTDVQLNFDNFKINPPPGYLRQRLP